jgi:cyclopropane fatty-acyl-phospholipid synthase-like methyltransferase
MDTQQTPHESAEVARFYDAARQSPLSAGALVHGEASIGQECTLTAEEIAAFARQAGITAGTWVLDVGSGTGGPACYLAQLLSCRVLGIDISAVGHAQAEARAREAGLSHLVQFRCDDVQTASLPSATFDVILSLDAWCHIPQRAALLQRCATLLRAGGRLAFYDHVFRQPLPEEQQRRFCTLWRFPDLETPASYVAAVQAAGLRLCAQDVTSAAVVRFYTRFLTQYRERRAEFETARGLARYQEGLERLSMSQQLAAAGILGQVAYIAEKPGDVCACAVPL